MLARRGLLAIAGLLVLATGLGVAAVRWDRPVMDALYLQPAWLLPAVRVLTRLGSWMVLVPAGVLGIWFAIRHHDRELAVRLGVGMAAAETFSELFKLIVGRARPDFLFQVSPRGASFPSGHSLNSLVVWCLLGAGDRLSRPPAQGMGAAAVPDPATGGLDARLSGCALAERRAFRLGHRSAAGGRHRRLPARRHSRRA